MADINHVVLVGRLTRDAELKYTSSGSAVSNFSIAINRRRKNGDEWVEEVSYIDIVVWGRTAESLSPYLVKGKQVGIEGELRQDRWEQDGQKRSRVKVASRNIQLLGGRGQQSSDTAGPGPPDYVKSDSEGPASEVSGPSTSGDDFEDDIPF